MGRRYTDDSKYFANVASSSEGMIDLFSIIVLYLPLEDVCVG